MVSFAFNTTAPYVWKNKTAEYILQLLQYTHVPLSDPVREDPVQLEPEPEESLLLLLRDRGGLQPGLLRVLRLRPSQQAAAERLHRDPRLQDHRLGLLPPELGALHPGPPDILPLRGLQPIRIGLLERRSCHSRGSGGRLFLPVHQRHHCLDLRPQQPRPFRTELARSPVFYVLGLEELLQDIRGAHGHGRQRGILALSTETKHEVPRHLRGAVSPCDRRQDLLLLVTLFQRVDPESQDYRRHSRYLLVCVCHCSVRRAGLLRLCKGTPREILWVSF